MSPDERIKRVAHAVARELGGSPLSFIAIVALVLWLDECLNRLDEWVDVRDGNFQRAAREGADELRENLEKRSKRQVAAA